jgi:hypothetical protein
MWYLNIKFLLQFSIFTDGAHLSEEEKKKENAKDDDQIGEDANEPEPFGVTSSARSKL